MRQPKIDVLRGVKRTMELKGRGIPGGHHAQGGDQERFCKKRHLLWDLKKRWNIGRQRRKELLTKKAFSSWDALV